MDDQGYPGQGGVNASGHGTPHSPPHAELIYRQAFDQMLSGFALHEIIIDEEGKPYDYRFIDINPAFERLTGLSRTHTIGRTILQIFPSIEKFWIETYGQVALTGKPTTFENYSADVGKWFQVVAFSPAAMQFACVFEDITERRKSREDLENIFTLSMDMLCIASLTHFIKVSPSFERTLGYSDEELCSRPFTDFVHPDDVGPTFVLIEEKLKRGEPAIRFRNRYRHKDGHYLWLEWMTKPLPDKDVLYAVARDVTEGVKYEDLIKEREFMLKESQRAAQVGTYSLDIAGGTWQCTDVLEQIFGIDVTHPKTVEGWLSIIHPDDMQMMNEHLSEIIRDRVSFDKEYRVVKPSTGQTHWVYGRGELVLDNEGNPIRMVGTIQDVTVRKLAQEHILKSLKEKEILLREVHHRVKNNLQVIQSLLMLQASYVKDPDAKEMFNETFGRIRSMSLVHEKLYMVTDFSKIDVHDYVKSLVDSVVGSFRKHSVHARIGLDIHTLSLDPEVLVPCGMIINELLTNAYKYAFAGRSEGTINIRFHALGDDMLELVVHDDGVGITESATAGEAKGLGLKLVETLADQLGGQLSFGNQGGARIALRFLNRIKFAKMR